jgi:hypothetical protein
VSSASSSSSLSVFSVLPLTGHRWVRARWVVFILVAAGSFGYKKEVEGAG